MKNGIFLKWVTLAVLMAALPIVVHLEKAEAQFTPGQVLGAAALNAALAAPTITGGSVNGAPIGANSASTGKFTTLQIGTGIPQFGNVATRTVALQSLTSTITPTNITGLAYSVAASEQWVSTYYLDVGANLATTGVKLVLTAPSGSTIDFKCNVAADTVVLAGSYVKRTATSGTALDFTATQVASAAEGMVVCMSYVQNSSTPGTAQIQFGQSTSSGTALSVRQGSYMQAVRVK